jgi:hypothetical protein
LNIFEGGEKSCAMQSVASVQLVCNWPTLLARSHTGLYFDERLLQACNVGFALIFSLIAQLLGPFLHNSTTFCV